jgi:glycosyltransferase involved in cell wall biosynthesis
MTHSTEKHLSFIIPVYQVKETLRACVESCARQEFLKPDEYEIILVDDGSTDGSAQICDELERLSAQSSGKAAAQENAPGSAGGHETISQATEAGSQQSQLQATEAGSQQSPLQATVASLQQSPLQTTEAGSQQSPLQATEAGSQQSSLQATEASSQQWPPITVIHTSNFGVSHARNIGLEKAKGRFVAFVDSDDRVADAFFDHLSRYADESTVVVDETDSYAGTVKLNGFQYIENSILNENTHVWGKIFDRKTLIDNNIRFKEGLTIGEDLLFLMDVALSQEKRHTIRCIPVEGNYIYNDNESGAMGSRFKESYLDQLVCWGSAEDRMRDHWENFSPYAFVSLGCSQIMTALLIIGKLAVLDEKDRDADLTRRTIALVKERIGHALKIRGTFAGLSAGYKLKVMLFRLNPELYIRMYHRHKS